MDSRSCLSSHTRHQNSDGSFAPYCPQCGIKLNPTLETVTVSLPADQSPGQEKEEAVGGLTVSAHPNCDQTLSASCDLLTPADETDQLSDGSTTAQLSQEKEEAVGGLTVTAHPNCDQTLSASCDLLTPADEIDQLSDGPTTAQLRQEKEEAVGGLTVTARPNSDQTLSASCNLLIPATVTDQLNDGPTTALLRQEKEEAVGGLTVTARPNSDQTLSASSNLLRPADETEQLSDGPFAAQPSDRGTPDGIEPDTQLTDNVNQSGQTNSLSSELSDIGSPMADSASHFESRPTAVSKSTQECEGTNPRNRIKAFLKSAHESLMNNSVIEKFSTMITGDRNRQRSDELGYNTGQEVAELPERHDDVSSKSICTRPKNSPPRGDLQRVRSAESGFHTGQEFAELHETDGDVSNASNCTRPKTFPRRVKQKKVRINESGYDSGQEFAGLPEKDRDVSNASNCTRPKVFPHNATSAGSRSGTYLSSQQQSLHQNRPVDNQASTIRQKVNSHSDVQPRNTGNDPSDVPDEHVTPTMESEIHDPTWEENLYVRTSSQQGASQDSDSPRHSQPSNEVVIVDYCDEMQLPPKSDVGKIVKINRLGRAVWNKSI